MNGAYDNYKVVRKNKILYGPSLNADIDGRGLGAFIFSAFGRQDENIFAVQYDSRRKETYSSIKEKTTRIAIEMRARGMKENDIIMICSSNTLDGMLPAFSAFYLNVIVSSIEATMPLRDVVHLVKTLCPKMIFVEPISLKLIEDALEELSMKCEIVVFGQHRNYTPFSEFLKPQVNETKFKPRNVEDDRNTALIFFSSGTTGMPKPICLSAFSMLSATISLLHAGIKTDVVAQCTTLYWISSFINILLSIINGTKLVVINHYPDVDYLFKSVQDCKITFLSIPGPHSYQINRENTLMYDLSSLDTMTFVGYPVSSDHVEKVQTYIPNACITVGYGMTEVAGYISLFTKCIAKSNYKNNISSSGKQLFNRNIKIVNIDTEETLGPNEEGEVRISTNTIMNGYYKMDSSAEFDSDGWFKTGDLGYYDEDNCLYVYDRIKDLLRYEPWQIVPISVESVINRHPAVQESVVIGIPKFEYGDVITALVVLKKNCQRISAEEIEKFANENLSDGEQLRGGLKIVGTFPKTVTGKTKRILIRDLYLKEHHGVKRINNVVYGPKLEIKTDRRGLGIYIFEHLIEHNDKIFQINSTTGETESYRAFNQRCVRAALKMSHLGVKQDDVVLVCSSNNMDVTVPIFGTLYIGAITASLDPSLPLRDTVHLLNIVRPKLIITEMICLTLMENSLKELNVESKLVVLGEHSKHMSFSEFLRPCVEEEGFKPIVIQNDSDTAVIFFSSGTTGFPKAICCSHFGLMYSILCYRSIGLIAKVGLHFTSFYWISAFLTTVMVITIGGKKVVSSVFEPHSTLKVIQDYKVTFVFLAPTYVYYLTPENTSLYDTSHLEFLIISGSPINSDQVVKCKNSFPKSWVVLLYGMTEASGYMTVFTKTHGADLARDKIISCGLPVPNSRIKIVDPDTENLLGVNEKGEIRFFSKTLANGYYNSNIRDDFTDADGYIKSGDIGYLDEDNCLYVCDRIKDMFKYQSWHIVPASIESIIYQHPAVKRTVVVGTPLSETDEVPLALVELRDEWKNIKEKELIKFVNERVIEREQLRGGLKIVKELPKTSTGKIVRRQIREMVMNGQI